jgi:hypothetical protein
MTVPDERDLLRFDIGHVELVLALPDIPNHSPSLPSGRRMPFLRELDIAGEQLRVGLVRQHRVQVSIHVPFEAGAIAGRHDPRLRRRRRRHDQEQRRKPSSPHLSLLR